jgi:hypothetical protein
MKTGLFIRNDRRGLIEATEARAIARGAATAKRNYREVVNGLIVDVHETGADLARYA